MRGGEENGPINVCCAKWTFIPGPLGSFSSIEQNVIHINYTTSQRVYWNHNGAFTLSVRDMSLTLLTISLLVIAFRILNLKK